MTARSCVSGLIYKAIRQSSCSNMGNMLATMLDSETGVSKITCSFKSWARYMLGHKESQGIDFKAEHRGMK